MPDGIKNALLIYNPTSGRRRKRRFEEIEKAVRILKDAGITSEIAATTAPGSAQALAQHAIQQRQDLVIARRDSFRAASCGESRWDLPAL
jgi:diacylglycerol kinase family enzyme